MSNTIKDIFLNYICCGILGGILNYLSPDSAKKTVRALVVAIIIISLFSPILSFDFNEFRIDENKNEVSQYQSLIHISKLTKTKIYNKIEIMLINLNISEYEIYVETDVLEKENTIKISEIKIEVDKKYKSEIPVITGKIPEEYQSILKVGVLNE